MSLFKCYNCVSPAPHSVPGRDFEADTPVCPDCALDGATADGAGLIVVRETIHFHPMHAVVKRKGSGVRACDGKPLAGGGYATPEPAVVNCPACRETDAFRALYEVRGEPTLAPTTE